MWLRASSSCLPKRSSSPIEHRLLHPASSLPGAMRIHTLPTAYTHTPEVAQCNLCVTSQGKPSCDAKHVIWKRKNSTCVEGWIGCKVRCHGLRGAATYPSWIQFLPAPLIKLVRGSSPHYAASLLPQPKSTHKPCLGCTSSSKGFKAPLVGVRSTWEIQV